MCQNEPTFGGMLRDLVELEAIEFRPEPLDDLVERRLKEVWTAQSCPHCDADSLTTLSGSRRISCGRCDWINHPYARDSLHYDSGLTPGEFLIAFVLYADTLLSINQIALFLSPCYKTLRETIRETETAFHDGFPTVRDRISQTVDGPTQVDETQHV